jgi:putative ABC transport system ATP-binding protein
MEIMLTDVSVILPGTGTPLFRMKKFEAGAGERVLVHGPSGIGKTTLLHLIAGLFLPSAGTVQVGGKDLAALTESERSLFRRNHFGMLFQKLNLIDHLTGWENVRLGIFDPHDADQRTARALKKLGMESFSHKLSGNLSMGEQQRLAAARVIAARPSIALIDEPTSSLDQENADLVMDALFSLPSETTMVMVSHDRRIRSRFTHIVPFEELVAR